MGSAAALLWPCWRSSSQIQGERTCRNDMGKVSLPFPVSTPLPSLLFRRVSIWLHYRAADDAPGWYPSSSRSQHPPLSLSLSPLRLDSAILHRWENTVRDRKKNLNKKRNPALSTRSARAFGTRSLDWWRRRRTGVLVSRASRMDRWMDGGKHWERAERWWERCACVPSLPTFLQPAHTASFWPSLPPASPVPDCCSAPHPST